jgi:hypothetical protein
MEFERVEIGVGFLWSVIRSRAVGCGRCVMKCVHLSKYKKLLVRRHFDPSIKF